MFAVHVGRVVRREKRDGRGDGLWASCFVERHRSPNQVHVDTFGELEVVGDRRVDRPWALPLLPHLGVRIPPRSCGSARARRPSMPSMRRPWLSGECSRGRDVHDVAAAVQQRRHRRAAAEKCAVRFPQGLVPGVGRELVRLPGAQDPATLARRHRRGVRRSRRVTTRQTTRSLHIAHRLGGTVFRDVDAHHGGAHRHPSSASRSAVARPMPDAAPVTIATRPSNRRMSERLERVLIRNARPAPRCVPGGRALVGWRQVRVTEARRGGPTRRLHPRPQSATPRTNPAGQSRSTQFRGGGRTTHPPIARTTTSRRLGIVRVYGVCSS